MTRFDDQTDVNGSIPIAGCRNHRRAPAFAEVELTPWVASLDSGSGGQARPIPEGRKTCHALSAEPGISMLMASVLKGWQSTLPLGVLPDHHGVHDVHLPVEADVGL